MDSLDMHELDSANYDKTIGLVVEKVEKDLRNFIDWVDAEVKDECFHDIAALALVRSMGKMKKKQGMGMIFQPDVTEGCIEIMKQRFIKALTERMGELLKEEQAPKG